MRFLWPALMIVFVQCSQNKDPEDEVWISHTVDTVYLEKPDTTSANPWELTCLDTAWTQWGMNICSFNCTEIADSISNDLYNDLLATFEKRIQRADGLYLHYCQKQKERLTKLRDVFDIIAKTAGEFNEAKYAGGSISPLMYNNARLKVIEYEIDLLESFKKETDL